MPSGELVIFVHQRWLSDGPHERDEIGHLEHLRPHLSRASLMAVKLGLERAAGAVVSMELMGLPAAVLSKSGNVQATNTQFGAMASVFISTALGSLAIAAAEASRLFQEIIQATIPKAILRHSPISTRDLPKRSAPRAKGASHLRSGATFRQSMTD
jgi:hypothetical protein